MPRAEELHEWVSFEDPGEQRTWVFDLTFLLSNWSCIFGSGCPGVLTEPAPAMQHGCCSYGAHFSEDEDRDRIQAKVELLEKDEWQLRRRQGKKGPIFVNETGDTVTKVVDGACIFLNRAGHPGGAGCAFHSAALRRGESIIDWKPEVCWQLPLRRHDESDTYGHVTSTLREWKRRDWGPGGDEFHWWCTEDTKRFNAFVGSQPVWETLREEIEAMTSPGAYRLLSAYLTDRAAGVAVAHPAIKRRPKMPK